MIGLQLCRINQNDGNIITAAKGGPYSLTVFFLEDNIAVLSNVEDKIFGITVNMTLYHFIQSVILIAGTDSTNPVTGKDKDIPFGKINLR